MATINRQHLLEEISSLSSANPKWGNRLSDLVKAFENDEVTFDELEELIKDYTRELENDQSISDVQIRTKTEVCLEMLFALAKAVA
jgi:hypothetical protein